MPEKNPRVDALLAGAGVDIEQLRLSKPAGANAVEKYREVLTLSPANDQAEKGLEKVAEKYMELSDKALLAGNLGKAKAHLASLQFLSSHIRSVSLKNKVEEVREILQEVRRVGVSSREAEKVYRQAQSTATVVVDATGAGDARSIVEAWRKVRSGGVILVRPGDYKVDATLRINHKVSIVGFHPDRTKITFTGNSNGMKIIGAGSVTISGVHLHYAGKDKQPTIYVTDSRLNLEDCRVSGAVYAGLEVSGATASAMVQRCEFSGNKQCGLFFHNGAGGTVSQSLFFANKSYGIACDKKSNPDVDGCLVVGNKGGGVYIFDRGRGSFRNNLISHNGWVNVGVKNGGNPLVQNNRLFRADQSTVFVVKSGKGTFKANRIHAGGITGSYPAIEVQSEGNPMVSENTIGPGNGHGIHLLKTALGKYVNNKIDVDNWRLSIDVNAGAKGVFHGNSAPDGVKGIDKANI